MFKGVIVIVGMITVHWQSSDALGWVSVFMTCWLIRGRAGWILSRKAVWNISLCHLQPGSLKRWMSIANSRGSWWYSHSQAALVIDGLISHSETHLRRRAIALKWQYPQKRWQLLACLHSCCLGIDTQWLNTNSVGPISQTKEMLTSRLSYTNTPSLQHSMVCLLTCAFCFRHDLSWIGCYWHRSRVLTPNIHPSRQLFIFASSDIVRCLLMIREVDDDDRQHLNESPYLKASSKGED